MTQTSTLMMQIGMSLISAHLLHPRHLCSKYFPVMPDHTLNFRCTLIGGVGDVAGGECDGTRMTQTSTLMMQIGMSLISAYLLHPRHLCSMHLPTSPAHTASRRCALIGGVGMLRAGNAMERG